MNFKKYTILIAFFPLALFAQEPKKAIAETGVSASEIKSSLDSVSYAMGISLATDLKARGITALNYSLLAKALAEGFSGNPNLMSKGDVQLIITNYFASAVKKKSEGDLAEGKKFLDDNKTKPGVITLPSGLQYLVLKEGSGQKPKPNDDITVHYLGTLINGTKFDSSYDRKDPLSLSLSQVISGWREGLQLMQVGSKYKLFIPWELGYGAKGAGEIPPYSVLVFEIELVGIGK